MRDSSNTYLIAIVCLAIANILNSCKCISLTDRIAELEKQAGEVTK